MDVRNANSNQTLTVTFSRSVRNLTFTLTDLDNSLNHRDAVAIAGEPFTYTYGVNSLVSGVGTVAAPFEVVGTANYDNYTASRGNVRIDMNGPVTTFGIRYWNRSPTADPAAANVTQSIFLTRMSFDAYADGCL